MSFASAGISQNSTVGQTAEMIFAVGLYAAQYECGVLKANGDLQSKISFYLIFRSYILRTITVLFLCGGGIFILMFFLSFMALWNYLTLIKFMNRE